jgi:FkbM family methyltransferase
MVPQRTLARFGWRVESLGHETWLLRGPKSRHRLHRLGGEPLQASLVWNRRRFRARPAQTQQRLAEIAEREQLLWVLRAGRVDCVIDAGANVGQYAKKLRRVGYRGRIVSFEPVQEAFDKLALAAEGDDNWWVRHEGLAAKDGTATMQAMHGTMSSMLEASEFGLEWSKRLRRTRTEEVTLRRLDGLLPELLADLDCGRVMLKMDTQGYDLEVFEGARGVLDRVVALQSEVSCVPIYDGMPTMVEQWEAYQGAGFESAGMYPVSFDRRTVRVVEYDVLMVRPDEMDGEARPVRRRRTLEGDVR